MGLIGLMKYNDGAVTPSWLEGVRTEAEIKFQL